MKIAAFAIMLAGCVSQAAAVMLTPQQEALRITKLCGLPSVAVVVKPPRSVWLRPSPDAPYEKIDCALRELRTSKVLNYAPMSFFGNERYDENQQ